MSSDLENGLKTHIGSLHQRLAEIASQIQSLVDESHSVEQRLDAATRLYEAEFGQLLHEAVGMENHSEGILAQLGMHEFREMSIADACAYILSERQQPTHVSVLVQLLKDGGKKIESQSPNRTIATTLYRNKQRFRKTSPGTFVLLGAATRNVEENANQDRNPVGLVQGAYQILTENRRPMHVKEIVEQLIARGAQYNTQRPAAMLSGSLRKSKSKFRPCGGDIWALVEWNESSTSSEGGNSE